MKSNEKQQARDLYLNTALTQKEIADYLSVSEKTIYLWIKQQSWDKLKQASLAAPAMVSNNLVDQLVELQNSIAQREEGKRFPTLHEAEITRKLVLCIDKLKLYPSQGACMQMMRGFIDFIGAGQPEFRNKVLRYANEYLEGKSLNGFKPYDISYNVQTHEEIRAEIQQAFSEGDGMSAENNPGISAANIISETEILSKQNAETQSQQSNAVITPTSENKLSPEKTGNSTANNSSPETDMSLTSFSEALARGREMNRILNEMKATQNNNKSSKYY